MFPPHQELTHEEWGNANQKIALENIESITKIGQDGLFDGTNGTNNIAIDVGFVSKLIEAVMEMELCGLKMGWIHWHN